MKGQSVRGLRPARAQGHRDDVRDGPQGADHTCGNALPSPANLDDPASPEGQAQISEFLQCYFAAIDSLGMCLFATLPALDIPELQGARRGGAAVTGEELGDDYLIAMGDPIVRGERDFNRRAGFTETDDRLPAFVIEEAVLRRATGTMWPRRTWTRCSRADGEGKSRCRSQETRTAAKKQRQTAVNGAADAGGDAFVVRALAKGLGMLSLFDAVHREWTLDEMVAELELPRMTGYRMARTLQTAGYLVTDPHQRPLQARPRTARVDLPVRGVRRARHHRASVPRVAGGRDR